MTRPAARLFVAAIVLSAPLIAAPPLDHHGLLRAPRTVPAHVKAPQDPTIVRSRLVELDLGPLGRRRGSKDVVTSVGERLHLDLFANAQRRVMLQSVTVGAGGAEVFDGQVEGDTDSSVAISIIGGELFANIRSHGEWYQVRYAGGGLHAVVEMDDSALSFPDEPIVPDRTAATRIAADESRPSPADDGSLIDLLVLYTPIAKTNAGGATAIVNMINTAVANTNTAYGRSSATQRLRVVHTAETVNWIDNGVTKNADAYPFLDALKMLRQNGDGRMDEAHTLRDSYGADIVALIFNRTELCGQAFMMQSFDIGNSDFAPHAFSVNHWNCLGNYTLSHEIGHNMGLEHDRRNASYTPAWPYAYGWGDPNGAFRDIMAYASACSPSAGSCTRILNFSNPDVLHNGVPTGSPLGTNIQAHNAKALNDGAWTMANLRQTVVASCSYALTPATTTVPAAGGTVMVTVTSGQGCAWTASTGSAYVTFTAGASGSGNGAVTLTVAANSGVPRSAVVTIADQTVTINQQGVVPQMNVNAQATTTTNVQVTWAPFSGATSYQISRYDQWDGWAAIGQTAYTTFNDGSAASQSSYLYRVRAVVGTTPSEYSAPDLATTVIFQDDPLATGSTTARARHLQDLRTAVDALRRLANLAALQYLEPATAGALVRATDITQLRTGVDQARTVLALAPAAVYTSGAVAGGTIAAAHFQELRTLVK